MSLDSPFTWWQSVLAHQQPVLKQQSTSEGTLPNTGFIWHNRSQWQLPGEVVLKIWGHETLPTPIKNLWKWRFWDLPVRAQMQARMGPGTPHLHKHPTAKQASQGNTRRRYVPLGRRGGKCKWWVQRGEPRFWGFFVLVFGLFFYSTTIDFSGKRRHFLKSILCTFTHVTANLKHVLEIFWYTPSWWRSQSPHAYF